VSGCPLPLPVRAWRASAEASRSFASLINHLIRPRQQRCRNCKAEGLGGLHVDDQLEFRRLLNGQVAGPGTLDDLIHVGRGAPIEIGNIWPVRREAAGVDIDLERVDGREPVPRGQLNQRRGSLSNAGVDTTVTAPGRARAMFEKARSNSSGPRASTTCSCMPSACAAASQVLSRSFLAAGGNRIGLQEQGHLSEPRHGLLEQLQRLAGQLGELTARPVTLPTGRARLVTSPFAHRVGLPLGRRPARSAGSGGGPCRDDRGGDESGQAHRRSTSRPRPRGEQEMTFKAPAAPR
jgi:hypothetical protein